MRKPILTCNTGEELPGEVLNLTARKWYKPITFEKVENALPKQVRDDANMVAEIERVAKVYALVSVGLVIESKR